MTSYADNPSTQYAHKAGRADYYAKTAKGNYAINRFPLASDEAQAWESGHQHAYFEQTRMYLAAAPETVYMFFGIKP